MNQTSSFVPVAPYSLERTVGAFARFPEELVDCVNQGTYRRAFQDAYGVALLDARQRENLDLVQPVEIGVRTLHGSPDIVSHTHTLTRMLSLNEPIEPLYGLMREHTRLRYLADSLIGLRRTLDPTPFEGLVSSILAQLISIRGAAVVRGRLVREFGTSIQYGDAEYWTFPTPEEVQDASVDQLCKLGMTGVKARAIQTVARLSVVGELDLAQLARHPDDVVIKHLTALPGIGPWTAEWFLINVLGRMSIVPVGDLGIRRATGKWLLGGEMPSSAATRQVYEPFGEFAGYVAYYVLSAERYKIPKTPDQ